MRRCTQGVNELCLVGHRHPPLYRPAQGYPGVRYGGSGTQVGTWVGCATGPGRPDPGAHLPLFLTPLRLSLTRGDLEREEQRRS